MAAIETTSRTAPLGAVAIYNVVLFVERAVRAVRTKLIADRTYGQLSKLTPDQLRDIGLGDRDLEEFSRTIARRA
ncbi:MAG: DUF1127 domain-containing protein [Pikeienuella sp.]